MTQHLQPSLERRKMKISAISFTDKGFKLSEKIKNLKGHDIEIFKGFGENKVSFKTWTKEKFNDSDALIFISAMGICVRAIAPYIENKIHDPCVIVIDDNANFCISVLSGHLGGGNELCENLSTLLCSTSVITTATDVNNVFAIDVFAKKNGLAIENTKAIKTISAKLLAGKKVYIKSDFKVKNLPKRMMLTKDNIYDLYITYKNIHLDNELILIPEVINVGLGARKNKDFSDVIELFEKVFEENNLNIKALKNFASIDIKKDEQAFFEISRKFDKKFYYFTKDELLEVEGNFTASKFVEKTVGVNNVCERAAKILGGEIILNKISQNGVTMAVALDDIIIDFKEKN